MEEWEEQRRGPSEQKILEDRGHFGLIAIKYVFLFCFFLVGGCFTTCKLFSDGWWWGNCAVLVGGRSGLA